MQQARNKHVTLITSDMGGRYSAMGAGAHQLVVLDAPEHLVLPQVNERDNVAVASRGYYICIKRAPSDVIVYAWGAYLSRALARSGVP